MVLALGGALGVACAPFGERHYARLTHALHVQAYADGLARIEHEKHGLYASKNELLYWLDKASFEDASGARASSNQSLECAKSLQRKLYTQHVVDHVEATLWGERMLPYSAEPFEQVALHLLEADHYMAQGLPQDALAELRQMDTTLARCNEAVAKRGSVYRDDAAGRYLSGLLREADRGELGHLSEARIDLARAVSLYDEVEASAFFTPCPPIVRAALSRVERALGTASVKRGRKPAGRAQAVTASSSEASPGGPANDAAVAAAPSVVPLAAQPSARAVLLFYDGLAPHKREAFWETLFPPWQSVVVAYPVFVPTPSARRAARLQATGSDEVADAQLVSNFEAKAVAHLAERMASLQSAAMARAVAKATASGALSVAGMVKGGQSGALMELAGFGLSVANAISEHADVRSWRTLPARLSVAELEFAAGDYELVVQTWGNDSVQRAHRYIGRAEPGDVVFLSVREL